MKTLAPASEKQTLESEISGNYKQMVGARHAGETILESVFERRMNRGLESYYDLSKTWVVEDAAT